MEKKPDGNYTRMLRAILNKSWRQHPTKQLQYGHRPPITKTIQIRLWWRSSGELISDVILWTPSQGWAKAGPPARTYIQQVCVDTGCSPEDLPEAMNDREGWWERVRDIRADGATWWWWWQQVWIQSFPSPSLVALPKIKSHLLYYLHVARGEQMNLYLPQGH